MIGEGVGTFTATEAGRHIACYQKTPGSPANPPDETGELGNTVTRPATTLGQPSTVPGALADGVLARTGVSIQAMLVLAILVLALGWRLELTSRP